MAAFVEQTAVTALHVEKVRFFWTVNNFALRPERIGEELFSPVFSSGRNANLKWRISLYPTGRDQEHREYLSIFLQPVEFKAAKVIPVKYQFSVVDQHGSQMEKKGDEHKFIKNDSGNGWRKFIKRELVLDPTSGMLPNGHLTFCCDINAAFIPDEGEVGDGVRADSDSTAEATSYDQLSSDLGRLLLDASFSDLTLEVGERQFPVHKNVLAARSVVFRAMFEHETQELQEGTVKITDVEADVIQELLHFIYTGKLSGNNNLDKLFVAADKYALEDLLLICQRQLAADLRVDNVVSKLILADRHSARGLQTMAMELMVSRAAEVVQHPSWDQMLAYPHLISDLFRALALRVG